MSQRYDFDIYVSLIFKLVNHENTIRSVKLFCSLFICIYSDDALECYFCEIGDPNCSDNEFGKEIRCSDDQGSINYGDACMVEHIGAQEIISFCQVSKKLI